jgi:2-C-methyl-D-erythritol 4-phosphate cytidylyltransferase
MIDGKSIGVVIPAAGTGRRMGGATAKQFLLLEGLPVLVRTVQRFDSSTVVDDIVLAVAESECDAVRALLAPFAPSKLRVVVPGGAERQDSVASGLGVLATDIVLVHDAVRPFASHGLIAAVAAEAVRSGAAVAAVRMKETIKIDDGAGKVLSTPERGSLWVAQTPQGFAAALLKEAFSQAAKEGFVGTDDASLVERLGVAVTLVEGEYDNIKITTPEDLEWAARIQARMSAARGG